MTPRRRTGAVVAAGAKAGIMASSRGKATAVPMPRRIVRRERDFLVTNIRVASCSFGGSDLCGAHLERRAFHGRENQGRPSIVVGCRGAVNGPDGGGVVVFEAA